MGWQGATALEHKNGTFLITLSHNWQDTIPQRRCLSWRDVPREAPGFESTHEAVQSGSNPVFYPPPRVPDMGNFTHEAMLNA